jgi:acetoin utilization deacetylase AcuC-like enzyme
MLTPVFYSPEMNVDGLESYSPSAGKPKRFCELLAHHDFRSYGPESLGKVEPVTYEDLCLVHAQRYVDGVHAGTILNGFENNDTRVAASCSWTIGALLAASRHAIKYPAIPACAPVSGFHHSGVDFGGGFCTFNGLMVVAAKLISEAPDRAFKVAILDLDMHTGDGTEDILRHANDFGGKVLHLTAGRHFYGDNPHTEGIAFQDWLQESIDEINAFQPDLVIAQLAADPHVHDPLGGYLTTAQLIQRDRAVFTGVKAPISWVLAGGYQRPKDGTIFTDPVLRIHRNTLIESDKSVKVRETFFESQS